MKNDLLNEKQEKRSRGLVHTLVFIMCTSVIILYARNCVPEQTQELPNPKMDFDDQDSLENIETWHMKQEFELEKDI